MNVKRAITPAITIGDQPSEADLKLLKDEGYTGIINLRNDGEPEQPLSPSAEGAKARALGLDYLHYGVGAAPLTTEGVSSVNNFINQHISSGKVMVHCRKSPRAAALVLIHQAQAQSWPRDQVISRGAEMGLDVAGGLKALVENYLDAHPDGQ